MKRIVLLFWVCGCSEDVGVAELDNVVMRRPPGLQSVFVVC